MSQHAQKTRWIKATLSYEHLIEIPVSEGDTFAVIEDQVLEQAECVYGVKGLKDWRWEALPDRKR